MALKKTSHGGGGTGAWCAPRTPGATAAWKQRRHLCRDTIEPGWTSSLSLPFLPATRPAPSGPSAGRTPRSSVLHGGNASSPPGRRERGGGEAAGGEAAGGGGVHRGPPPQSAAWVLEGTRAPRSGGGSPVREGAGRGRKRAGRPRRQGGGGIRAPSLVTPNLEPRTCGQADSGLSPFHVLSLSGPPIQVQTNSTSLAPSSPPFGTQSIVPPPSLAPDPSPHSPPITTHRPTLGKQCPTLLPSPTWGLDPRPLLHDWNQTYIPPPTFLEPLRTSSLPYSGARRLGLGPLLEETLSPSSPGTIDSEPLPFFRLSFRLPQRARTQGPSPLWDG